MVDYERLKLFRLEKKISQKLLSDMLEMSQGAYSDVERGRNGISYNLLSKLTTIFSVNANWIITGEGEMFIGELDNLKKENPSIKDKQNQFPILDLKAIKQYPSKLNDPNFLPSLPTFHFPLPEIGRAMAFQFDGNNMEERIQHQDYVIGTLLEDLEQLEVGHVYVFVMSRRVLCRRLREVGERILVLGSDHPHYGTRDERLDRVKEVWQVKYVLSGNMKEIAVVGAKMEIGKGKLRKRELEGEVGEETV